MSEEVLVALIGLAGSGLGSVLGILVSSKLTQYRLGGPQQGHRPGIQAGRAHRAPGGKNQGGEPPD